jgi:excisionase family DNA binding protein
MRGYDSTRLLRTAEVADRLGMNQSVVQRLCRLGRLPAVRVHPSGPWLIDSAALEALLEPERQEAEAA